MHMALLSPHASLRMLNLGSDSSMYRRALRGTLRDPFQNGLLGEASTQDLDSEDALLKNVVLYPVTKGVKQKYLLYIYLMGSMYINIDISNCSNIQYHNWLTGGESIRPPLQMLDELLAPPLLDPLGLQFL